MYIDDKIKNILIFQEGLMKHINTNLCMEVTSLKNSQDVLLKECDSKKVTQKWEFIYGS